MTWAAIAVAGVTTAVGAYQGSEKEKAQAKRNNASAEANAFSPYTRGNTQYGMSSDADGAMLGGAMQGGMAGIGLAQKSGLGGFANGAPTGAGGYSATDNPGGPTFGGAMGKDGMLPNNYWQRVGTKRTIADY